MSTEDAERLTDEECASPDSCADLNTYSRRMLANRKSVALAVLYYGLIRVALLGAPFDFVFGA